MNIFLVIDKYVLEHFGPRGLTKLIRRISKLYFDAGSFVYVFRYSFLILFCLLIVVAVCVLI